MNDGAYLRQKLENSGGYYGQSFSNRYTNWKRRKTILDAVGKHLARGNREPVRILDAGCFEGDLLFKLRSRWGSRFTLNLTGIDLAPAAVEFANERKEHEKVHDCRFQVMDANSMTFDDASFDMVISTEVLEHMTDPLRVLREIHRVLKPGGTAILTTPNGGMSIVRRLARIADILTFRLLARRAGATTARHKLPETIRQGLTETGIGHGHVSVLSRRRWSGLCHEAGFTGGRFSGTGGVVFGGPPIDEHRILFGLSVILDTLLEKLPCSYYWSEILQFELIKR